MYSMRKAAALAEIPYETLKFYCREGLIPGITRGENHRLIFEERHIFWLKGILCLKNCGMGLQEIKDYLGLLLRKDPDIPALKRILAQKRGELVEAMARLQESIDFIDRKQSIYDEVLAGRAEELGIPSPAQILAGLEDNASGSPFPSAGT